MRKVVFYQLFLLLTLFSAVQGQGTNPVLWQNLYFAPEVDYQGMEMKSCPEGGYIVVGSVMDTLLGERDMLFLRINESGEVIWHRMNTKP